MIVIIIIITTIFTTTTTIIIKSFSDISRSPTRLLKVLRGDVPFQLRHGGRWERQLQGWRVLEKFSLRTGYMAHL